MSVQLAVPKLPRNVSGGVAASIYAGHGWFVGPVAPGTKNPGSRLGKGWHLATTRNTRMVRNYWLQWPRDGVFIHAGRSGAVIFDVDSPDRLPRLLADAIEACKPPFQATRTNIEGKGHYVFAQPTGRVIGNSVGRLGGQWGEVRGLNGVVLVEPSEHPDEDEGGLYRWASVGVVPTLPQSVADLLPDVVPKGAGVGRTARRGLTQGESVTSFAEFVAAHDNGDARRLRGILRKLDREIAQGRSRHDATRDALLWAMKEANAGLIPASVALREIRTRFYEAFPRSPT